MEMENKGIRQPISRDMMKKRTNESKYQYMSKNIEMSKHQDVGTQRCRNIKMPEYQDAGISRCRNKQMSEYRDVGI